MQPTKATKIVDEAHLLATKVVAFVFRRLLPRLVSLLSDGNCACVRTNWQPAQACNFLAHRASEQQKALGMRDREFV